jgi:hypothetical protein
MKLVVLLLAAMVSQTVIAGNGIERNEIDFSAATELSSDAQVKVTELLNKRCQPATSRAAKVKVELVSVDVESVDQGIQDFTYDMAISLNGNQNDTVLITLKEYQVSNPAIDKFEVLKLVSKKSCR